MKKLILITLLSIATLAQAQTTKPIEGFLGIKFGSTKDQVIQALKAKGAVQDVNRKEGDALIFSRVKLGDRETDILFVRIFESQAYEAQFLFSTKPEAKIIEFYDTLIKDITGVYGNGNASKNFKEPYKDGDGYELTAIRSGNAKYQTYWKIDDNYITCTIELDKEDVPTVLLRYTDGKLFKQRRAMQQEKNKSDF